MLGCEVRTITNYINQNSDFPSRVRGRKRDFPLRRCVQWKIDRVVADAITSMAPPPPTGLFDAESRKAIADAELAELKVKKLRGEVVPVRVALQEIEKAYARVRGRFAAVPGEFASRMLHLESMPEATLKLRDLVATVLVELQQAGGAGDDDDDADDEGATEGVPDPVTDPDGGE